MIEEVKKISSINWNNFNITTNDEVYQNISSALSDTGTLITTVTQVTLNGKSTIIEKDRTKTKSSYRTLPLVPPFEELLHRLKLQQEQNRKLCGKSYNTEAEGYIYVNEIGELVKPGYITQHFPLILEKYGLRKIRFHDLRHSCASLLYANGVSLKEIQEWLGHSDILQQQGFFCECDPGVLPGEHGSTDHWAIEKP